MPRAASHGSGASIGLLQQAQVGGEVAGGDQGVGVVGAQHPAVAVEGVLVQVAGGLHLPRRAQDIGGVAGGDQVRAVRGPDLSDSQADSAGSIPVTRSVTRSAVTRSVARSRQCPAKSGGLRP